MALTVSRPRLRSLKDGVHAIFDTAPRGPDAWGTIAAWASFDTFYPRAAYDGTAMIALYVSATHRRQGVGRHLLAAAISRAPMRSSASSIVWLSRRSMVWSRQSQHLLEQVR